MDRAEAEAIYDAGREAVVEVLLAMDRRIAQLEARVEQLERQLRRDSRNSSAPPSSDPPGVSRSRQRREQGSERRQGAQPGHEGHGRELLPTEAVDEVVEYWPERCACGHAFGEGERAEGVLVARHQVEELPQLATRVTEHQLRRVRCPDCGREQRGELPVGVARSAFGPRLQAAVAVLAVRNRVSRRDTVELCEELFGARISAGSVDSILARTGDALAEPYEQLLDSARRSKHLNMDETGWRLHGQQRTLWGAFSKRHAIFKITESRHADHAKTLLEGHRGIVTSDRWWAYNQLPLARRQICWADLRRDFKAHAEGFPVEREFAEHGLRVCDQLFWAWEIYQHTGDRQELQRRIRLLRRELKPILRQYCGKAPRYRPGTQPLEGLASTLDVR